MTDDIREIFMNFLNDHGLERALTNSGNVTQQVERNLKYLRIDRYDVSLLTRNELSKILEFVNEFHTVMDVYFAYGQLCIGYYDQVYGSQKRFSAFQERSLEGCIIGS